MPSVIRYNGQGIAHSPDWRPGQVAGFSPASPNNLRKGTTEQRAYGAPIAADSPQSPFRVGIPHYDDHEDVTYRVVANLNIAEGWGTAAFWQRRWKCRYSDILHLVQRGYLDAVIEHATHLKRYRCRDEHAAIELLRERTVEAARKIVLQDAETRGEVNIPPQRTKVKSPEQKPLKQRRLSFKKGRRDANSR